MNIFRRLWTGLVGNSVPSERYQPYYIRPKRCPEVVIVRVDVFNDLSVNDDGGFFVHKTARGERCPFAAEVSITFDKNRRPLEVTVENGEQVTEADYLAWITPKEQA